MAPWIWRLGILKRPLSPKPKSCSFFLRGGTGQDEDPRSSGQSCGKSGSEGFRWFRVQGMGLRGLGVRVAGLGLKGSLIVPR